MTMEGSDTIRAALERNAKAVAVRPSVGQGTAVTKARLQPGLACEIEEGPWRFTVGMTEKYGGTNAGPNPGVYGRAALASCLAINYAMWAARLEVSIDALEVEVQADYDMRGELAVSDDPPGYVEVRYVVSLESTAPEALQRGYGEHPPAALGAVPPRFEDGPDRRVIAAFAVVQLARTAKRRFQIDPRVARASLLLGLPRGRCFFGHVCLLVSAIVAAKAFKATPQYITPVQRHNQRCSQPKPCRNCR